MRFLYSHLIKLIRDEKGFSLVKFALITLLLLLLLLGALEFGWILNAQIDITNAARKGAQAVALEEDPLAAVERHVAPTALTVTEVVVMPGGDERDLFYKVQVDGQIDPLIGVFLANKVNLKGIATTRQE